MKKVLMDPQGMYLTTNAFNYVMKTYELDHVKNPVESIGGTFVGGALIAASLCFFNFASYNFAEYRPNFFYIRKEAKKHGTESLIEGYIPEKKDKIVLFEDVTTTGNSVIKDIHILRGIGCTNIHTVYTIVDRESGAKEKLEKLGIRLVPLFYSSDFIKKGAT